MLPTGASNPPCGTSWLSLAPPDRKPVHRDPKRGPHGKAPSQGFQQLTSGKQPVLSKMLSHFSCLGPREQSRSLCMVILAFGQMLWPGFCGLCGLTTRPCCDCVSWIGGSPPVRATPAWHPIECSRRKQPCVSVQVRTAVPEPGFKTHICSGCMFSES